MTSLDWLPDPVAASLGSSLTIFSFFFFCFFVKNDNINQNQ